MKKALHYLRPYYWQIVVIIVMTYLSVWASLQLPTIMSEIVNTGMIGNNWQFIIDSGIHMILITIGGSIATIIAGYFASRAATGFARDLRQGVFNHIHDFSLTEINRFSTASLITRSTNDIMQLQQVILLVLRVSLQAPMIAIGAIFSALHIAPNMAWIIGLSVAVLLIMVITICLLVIPKFKLQQKLVDSLNLVARENLTGIRVIRAFNNESTQETKFDKINHQIADLNLWINRINNILQPGMTMVISFTTLTIIWVGAHLAMAGDIEIGNMMAFIQYATQIIMGFLMLIIVIVILPRGQVSNNRINEVLKTAPSITNPKNPAKLPKQNAGEVQFHQVTFSYPGAEQPVLNNINFTAKPGQITAIIGSTGSGKSTLINLIPRLYDVTAGQITIDGQDIRDLNQSDLIKLISFAPQKAKLFSGTIKSNLKLGNKQAKNQQLVDNLTIAQANFVNELPDKLDHEIAQGGTNVSGGQKQRLSIARALTKDSPILIFDDSFSALDYKTDAKLRRALKKNVHDKTILIVAQRISTIQDADQIIVLDQGSVVGKGTHYELLKTNDVYRQIAKSQFSDSEYERELQEASNGKN